MNPPPKPSPDGGITVIPGRATNKLAKKIRPIQAAAMAHGLPRSDNEHLTGRLEEATPWR